MKIEQGYNPNCSEAVMRFFTLEPEKIQAILQAIADEINAVTDFEPHKGQIIPLLPMAEDYARPYVPTTEEEWKAHLADLMAIRAASEKGKLTLQETDEAYETLWRHWDQSRYPKGTLIWACAGMGDNQAVITIEHDKVAFRLNIGNNDIEGNITKWVEKVIALGIDVEEAETTPELQEYARDCTCGIEFGFPLPDAK